MKRIILLIFVFTFLISGCSIQNSNAEKQNVTINLPTDNTVNGYRLDGYVSPDLIPQDKVSVSSGDNKASSYCGNKNSKVYHSSSCDSVSKMKDTNKVYFSTKEEYTQNGYTPCQKCNP